MVSQHDLVQVDGTFGGLACLACGYSLFYRMIHADTDPQKCYRPESNNSKIAKKGSWQGPCRAPWLGKTSRKMSTKDKHTEWKREQNNR
jgi:hypothetical protein